MPDMMTLTEIEAATINSDVAREAYSQTEKRLDDTLATKASYEQKAFALLATYVTVAAALFGASGLVAANSRDASALIPALLFAGALYTLGAMCALVALWAQTYGAPGAAPSMWLRPGVIDGSDRALPAMLAYMTFYHQERIEAGTRANGRKSAFVRAATGVGIGATLVLATWMTVVIASI